MGRAEVGTIRLDTDGLTVAEVADLIAAAANWTTPSAGQDG
jgi:hypothetical protein